MADEGQKLLQWDGKVGPATIATVVFGAVQISVIVGTVLLTAGAGREAVENSKAAVIELRNIVLTMQAASAQNSERLTRVEGRLDNVEKQGDRIERKIDIIGGPATIVTPPRR